MSNRREYKRMLAKMSPEEQRLHKERMKQFGEKKSIGATLAGFLVALKITSLFIKKEK